MDNYCRILLIDDDKNIRRSLQVALQNKGFEVHLAQDAQQAFQTLQKESFDILVVDVVLGEFSGVDFFSRIRQQYPETPVIFMSGEATLTEVAKLMRLGAADFLEKPFTEERLILSIERSLEFSRLQNRIQYLEKGQTPKEDEIYGDSNPIREVRELISRVARSNAHILVTGESGTGKELIAKQIHLQSKRSNEAFIKINCSAIPETLIESELFGHERGSFTGATQSKKGYFELANKGTLFLDEIGDMSLAAQAKILRAIQSGEIQAVGSISVRKVDIRLIAATHKDLKKAVQTGEFREDLYFRINVVPIHLCPLRERSEDIPLLAEKLIRDIALENSYIERTFSADALELISRWSWPGNIRELRNFLERLLIMGGAGLILPEDLTMPFFFKETQESLHPVSLKEFRDSAEREYIVGVLKKVGGNISKTAELLEIERTYLHRRLGHFKIEKREYL
ncbi:MAG TPA: sigma-54 dependent transcriptional regulator [Pseudobdellovibrionaceae bacterium]|jgi:two-component system nitrogen regulation response regulator NtrX